MSITSRGDEVPIIYGLRDPRDGRIYYVGKTCQPDIRLARHLRPGSNCDKDDWIASLAADGERPEMTILELVAPHKDWREREKFWITYGRQFSWPLVNHMLMLDHRGAYIHVKVDDELYLQFRLMCLREGTTMTRKIDGMIRQVLVEYSRKELAAAREQQGGGEEE